MSRDIFKEAEKQVKEREEHQAKKLVAYVIEEIKNNISIAESQLKFHQEKMIELKKDCGSLLNSELIIKYKRRM